MLLDIYQIDAFTQKTFEGNPAAVCPLDYWIKDEVMQNIAFENNLSETAFFVQEKDSFYIRWFTPSMEVDMCGHATLATAYVLFNYLGYDKEEIVFNSKSGRLSVIKDKEKLKMDFPIQVLKECKVPEEILQAFEKEPIACYQAMDYVVVFDSEKDILEAKPKLEILKKLNPNIRGIIITSKSKKYDFINRFFAPNAGIDEDSVTGSAFTQLVPYWAKVLSKDTFHAKQVSQRGGEVFCNLKKDRVEISGYATIYLHGKIEV